MAKGYWIGHVRVDDPQAYERYRQSNGPALAAFGGRFLVRGGPQEVVEGTSRARSVVIEFPTYKDALDCYHSALYQQAKAIRTSASEADVIIVEGADG